MGREAIILAGGKGTRLQSVVSDLPKPMAPIGEVPFVLYLLKQLKANHFEKAILSVGYKYESIQAYFGDNFEGMHLEYAVELEPLGTGGGIQLAFGHSAAEKVFIFNGDTYFDVDIDQFEISHKVNNALLSLALKPMLDFDRYGTVSLNPQNRVVEFREKAPMPEGLINGGVYIISKSLWETVDLPQKFSFEKDVMEAFVQELPFFGFISEGYFIDIGIPEDYARAQDELPGMF